MKIRKWFAGICIATAGIMSLASCGADSKKQTTTEAEAQKQGVIVLNKGEVIAPEKDKLTVIDFNATWCHPCRKFAPVFDKAAEEYSSDAVFYSVDVDMHPELAARYEVTSIPTVAYVKPDGFYTTTVGLMGEEQFKAAIEEAMK